MTEIVPAVESDLAQRAERINQATRRFAGRARSPRTIAAYDSDWATFAAWCATHGRSSLPAEPMTIADYISDLAEGISFERPFKPSTINRVVASIAVYHRTAGFDPPPTRFAPVPDTLDGIKKTLGVAPSPKAAATTPIVVQLIADLDASNPEQARDRALILIGFAGAFRRSELVSLDLADFVTVPDGLRVTLRRSKTDQAGEGTEVGLTYGSKPSTCPVRAWIAWRSHLLDQGHTDGPAFRAVSRSGNIAAGRMAATTVRNIIRRRAEGVVEDPESFSAHSLRSGMATQAAKNGANDREIMRQGRWSSRTTLDRYVRAGRLFEDNVSKKLGL